MTDCFYGKERPKYCRENAKGIREIRKIAKKCDVCDAPAVAMCRINNKAEVLCRICFGIEKRNNKKDWDEKSKLCRRK